MTLSLVENLDVVLVAHSSLLVASTATCLLLWQLQPRRCSWKCISLFSASAAIHTWVDLLNLVFEEVLPFRVLHTLLPFAGLVFLLLAGWCACQDFRRLRRLPHPVESGLILALALQAALTFPALLLNKPQRNLTLAESEFVVRNAALSASATLLTLAFLVHLKRQRLKFVNVPEHPLRGNLALNFAAVLTFVATVSFMQLLSRDAQEEQRLESDGRAQAMRFFLESQARRAEDFVTTLQESGFLADVITMSYQDPQRATAELRRICSAVFEMGCTLLGDQGKVLARSRAFTLPPESLQRALFATWSEAQEKGRLSRLTWALPEVRAYLVAQRGKGKSPGQEAVLVVRSDFDSVPSALLGEISFPTFFMDPKGKVFLSAEPELASRPLFPADGRNGEPSLAQGSQAERLLYKGRPVHVRRSPTRWPGYEVVVFSEPRSPRSRLLAAVLGLMVLCGTFLASLSKSLLRISTAKASAAMNAERQAEETQRRLAELLENTPEFVGISNSRGKMIYLNRAARLGYGIPPERATEELNLFDFVPVERQKWLMSWLHGKETQTGLWQGESVVVTNALKRLSVAYTIIAHREGGDLSHFSFIVRDITEIKRLESERERIQAQLYHSSKLASLGVLASGIAHEVKNPLAIIMGYIRIMRGKMTEMKLLPEHEALLDSLLTRQEQSAERIQKTLLGLNTFARAEPFHAEDFDVGEAMQQCVELVRGLYASQAITLELRSDEGPVWIHGSADRLKQVVLNLLTNARDALQGRDAPCILVELTKCDQKAVIRIADNGSGIDPEALPHIFDPFFTTKPAGKGTGLGLSISYAIVRDFSGEMEVASEPGKGTTFTITIPARPSRGRIPASA